MLKEFLIKQINQLGYEVVRKNKAKKWPSDFEEKHISIIQKVKPFTMTSEERLFGLLEAVQYVERHQLPGAYVECGVWKGGSMLAMAEMLMQLNVPHRDLFLYDTFEGMSAPTENDVSYDNEPADALLQRDENKEKNLIWAYSPLDTVKSTMQMSSYPSGKIHYIKGKVEDTIPAQVPEQISLLRLDTDWYESTRHELVHLYPRLVSGGVLIIDDYGFWKGARKAVDEFIADNSLRLLLNRMDETGRIAIKP